MLESVHPSPLSAYNGFFGCKHFSKCNAFLEAHGIDPIDWVLPIKQYGFRTIFPGAEIFLTFFKIPIDKQEFRLYI